MQTNALWLVKKMLPINYSLTNQIYIYIKLATVIDFDTKAPFSLATTPKCREGLYSILSALLHSLRFTLEPNLIMLSAKQSGIKYHFFFTLWYDSTWDWTPVFRTIGEHSTRYANDQAIGIIFRVQKVKENGVQSL